MFGTAASRQEPPAPGVRAPWYTLNYLRYGNQRHRLTWERMARLIERFLPSPRVLHPWPDHRFNVKYSR
jgi:RNA-directed DNA polymerase